MGSIHQGERHGSKASTAITYLPAAVAAGAEIRPESVAIGIEQDARGRVTAVIYRRDGVERRQRCDALVLAGGGVETPRLLLHAGIANSSGMVGRNFLAHGAVQVWGRFDEQIRGYRGYPSALITEDFVRPSDADFAGGYLLQSLGVMPFNVRDRRSCAAEACGDSELMRRAGCRPLQRRDRNERRVPPRRRTTDSTSRPNSTNGDSRERPSPSRRATTRRRSTPTPYER